MTVYLRLKKALATLLPAGVLGISSALAAALTGVPPVDRTPRQNETTISERLREIRRGVSAVDADGQNNPNADTEGLLAQWANFGFGGGGWRNGGWHNWHNWGNGGWRNWGNGGWHNWHNWHNFWHNW